MKAERGAAGLPWWGEIIASQVVEDLWRAEEVSTVTGSIDKVVVFVRVTCFGLGDCAMKQLCAVRLGRVEPNHRCAHVPVEFTQVPTTQVHPE